jgi:WXXGXW repeat (2 copies)
MTPRCKTGIRRQLGTASAAVLLGLAPLLAPAALAQPTTLEPRDAPAARGLSVNPDAAVALVRSIEHQADSLWQAALAGDWAGATTALEAVNRSVAVLRGGNFEAAYIHAGGQIEALDAGRRQLDSSVGDAELALAAQTAPSLMLCADRLMLAAADLTSEIARPLQHEVAVPALLVAPVPPPPPLAELVAATPSPQYAWIPGYWGWDGEWIWEAGRYMLRPHPGAEWVPGRWEHRGRHWVWIPGRWS